MQFLATPRARPALLLIVLTLLAPPPAAGQTQGRPPEQEEVIRVTSELVQTGVTVLDREGRFVDGLGREQFELRVDGRPQPIAFFERVAAGGAGEEAQLAAARGVSRGAGGSPGAGAGGSPDRGRTFFFFVDDLHMGADSITRARRTILQFVERDMGQNDQAAVTSSSNQLGFLQQLTGSKAVLRAAAARLRPLPRPTGDMQEPHMSEYLALAIQEQQDREVLGLFVEALLRETGMMRPDMAERIVRSRADQTLREHLARTRNTLGALGGFVRGVAPLPGRKVVYFLSEGFLLHLKEPSLRDQLRGIADAAARNGVNIYTADARGLSPDPSLDAGSRGIFDNAGIIARATKGELAATQEALRTIADETGGRALLNTNAIDEAIARSVKETSTYYLLAWQPAAAEQKAGNYRRVEVSVRGRPDLTVLAQRGFLQAGGEAHAPPAGGAASPAGRAKTPAEELRAAIAAPYPARALPTAVAVSYVNTPQEGTLMTASMSVPFDALAFDPAGGQAAAEVDVEGHVYNDRGESGSRFRERLKVSPAAAPGGRAGRSLLYSHRVGLAPGLYQVRVAARDARSGRVGSAAEWIEIPDLKSGALALGALQIGERPPQTGAAPDAQNFVGQFSADRRFTRDSHLRFLTFIYNASRAAQGGAPDVVLQIQIFRNDQPVVTDELRRVAAEGQDPARIAYGAEISLASLALGRYVLQVTVIDRAAKTSASQRAGFTVE